MSKSKSIGTRFESMCVEYLREHLGDDGIERRALHGSKDMGDLFGLVAHDHDGVVECKSHKRYGPADVAEWRSQTIDERENAGADFALLVIHRPGCGRARFGRNECQMQVRDLERIAGGTFTCLAGETAKDIWVSMSLEDACDLMSGE